jgi:hypothetical protein
MLLAALTEGFCALFGIQAVISVMAVFDQCGFPA